MVLLLLQVGGQGDLLQECPLITRIETTIPETVIATTTGINLCVLFLRHFYLLGKWKMYR